MSDLINNYSKTQLISTHGFIYQLASAFYQTVKGDIGTLYEKQGILRHGYPIVYITTQSLLKLPNFPNQPFVLLTGDSDNSVNFNNFYNGINQILTNPFLKKWYVQNWALPLHPKVRILPIGLDYHSLSKRDNPIMSLSYTINPPKKLGWGDLAMPLEQEKSLEKIQKPLKRQMLCYVNFGEMVKDRSDALKEIPSHLIYENKNSILRKDFWSEMSKFYFVISPHGYGLDCHRTWEALVLGCIPIVKKSWLSVGKLYEDLPVLIVDNWSDITLELLEKTKNELFTNKIPVKMYIEYWKNLIMKDLISK